MATTATIPRKCRQSSIRSPPAKLISSSARASRARPRGVADRAAAFRQLACVPADWATVGVAYSDLGPFRAIRRDVLEQLKMTDRNYGWTVEMQINAAKAGCKDILKGPVSYRLRIGTSKISGTLRGTLMAGFKILTLIGRSAVRSRAGNWGQEFELKTNRNYGNYGGTAHSFPRLCDQSVGNGAVRTAAMGNE